MDDLNLDKRYQTLIALWFAMLMNIAVFFLIAFFAGPDIDQTGRFGSLLTFTLAAFATFLVVLSFAVKRKLLERSVDRQDINLVQKALVIACAICEAVALLGLLERFIFRHGHFYLLLLVAAIGTALHFPRREQLQAASYRKMPESQNF